MKTLNITIPANSSTGALGFAGNYFRVEEATDNFWLRLGNRALIEIKKGIEGQAPKMWEQVELENKTAAPVMVTIVIGMTDTLTLRSFLVVGDVSITGAVDANVLTMPDIDVPHNRDPLLSNEFVNTSGTTNFTGYMYEQLWNPAGSGVVLVLDWIKASAAGTFSASGTLTNDSFFIGYNSVALATAGSTSRNRYLGGAAPKGQVKYNAAITGPVYTETHEIPGGAGPHSFEMDGHGYVIPEDMGIFVRSPNATAVSQMNATFKWHEE